MIDFIEGKTLVHGLDMKQCLTKKEIKETIIEEIKDVVSGRKEEIEKEVETFIQQETLIEETKKEAKEEILIEEVKPKRGRRK